MIDKILKISLALLMIPLQAHALDEERGSNRLQVSKKESREIISGLCKNYRIVLPKLMGCVVCQFFHELVSSDRYKHFKEREFELTQFENIISQCDFDPCEALSCLNEINQENPFTGRFSINFFHQCQTILKQLRHTNSAF